jgi:hypothetical protein
MGNAQTYDKLTPKQSELLAKITDVAEEVGSEPLLVATLRNDGVALALGDATAQRTHLHTEEDWSAADAALSVLHEFRLVKIIKVEGQNIFFALRQEALDYPGWRSRPRWQRWLSVKWDSWESDVRGGIITIVTSVGASLLFTLLVNLLFG